MSESTEGFDPPVPMVSTTIRAIQSAMEYAMIQNMPVTTAHLLFGILMTDNTAGSTFLQERGISVDQVMDIIPTYLPPDEPPF